MNIQYVIIHTWPDDPLPTIMPIPYADRAEATLAVFFFKEVASPGHTYTVGVAPQEWQPIHETPSNQA